MNVSESCKHFKKVRIQKKRQNKNKNPEKQNTLDCENMSKFLDEV